MTISIDPHVFGSPFITWVALFTLAGIALGLALMMGRLGNSAAWGRRRELYSVGLWAVFWGLVGARLFHVIDFWDFYSTAPFQSLYLWSGGLSLWGALLVGGGGALWHARRRGFQVKAFADSLAIAGLAGLAVGRIGDLISGERPGTGTSWPWAVEYTHPASESFAGAPGIGTHPIEAYELLLALAVLGVVLAMTGRLGSVGRAAWRWSLLPEGASLVAAGGMLAAGRFVIGFVRTESTMAGLMQSQWVAIAVLLGAVLYTLTFATKGRFTR